LLAAMRDPVHRGIAVAEGPRPRPRHGRGVVQLDRLAASRRRKKVRRWGYLPDAVGSARGLARERSDRIEPCCRRPRDSGGPGQPLVTRPGFPLSRERRFSYIGSTSEFVASL